MLSAKVIKFIKLTYFFYREIYFFSIFAGKIRMYKSTLLSINMTEIKNEITSQNPFLVEWDTPHQTVPFNHIKLVHFEPAIREGICLHRQEIERIITNSEAPSFQNTIEAIERSGCLLEKTYNVLENLLSAESNDELQAIAEKLSPDITAHFNDISLNESLFQRTKELYDQKELLNLSSEELKLLENSYIGFIRHGANLSASDKLLYRKLTEELSLLSLQYGQNILKETGNYQLHLLNKEQVIGIPEGDLEAAALTAKVAGKEGWIFTLQAPSFMPFMKYQRNRELRKELYIAYNTRCTKEGEYNNYPLVVRMVNLRREIAQLLGFKDYAEYVLQRRMAENEEAVFKLLDELLIAYRPTAIQEVKAIQQLAQELDELDPSDFCGWDMAYYANLLKERNFQLNDEQLRPYFPLQNVISGVFGLATRLYGITFKKSATIPVYHPDVEAFEVFDKDGLFLAVLYTDFFPREGKRPGAWMTEYKGQWLEKKATEKGTSVFDSRPHVSLVMNFTKPTESKPALLTLGEVETFLHEFGHSLHGMFAQATYDSLSGTNVYWDFVELPSQFMENFATEKEFLATFAQHYKTGETIPAELIERVKKASNFNVAYGCLRQLSFGLLDMAWYTQNKAFEGDGSAIRAFEKNAMESTCLLPSIPEASMSVQFSHIFAGGYSAGYYSYKWAEVLDADAFSLFKEKGIFNSEVANAFRENILSKGGTEHPMVLYKRFRGQEPTIDALLRRNGIIKNPE